MNIIKKLKRLKQLEKSLRISNEMLELQGSNGNYNVDTYMTGLYNGMEYIISLMEVRAFNPVDCKTINYKNHVKVDAKELIKSIELESNKEG